MIKLYEPICMNFYSIKALPYFFYFGPQNLNIRPRHTGDILIDWLASSKDPDEASWIDASQQGLFCLLDNLHIKGEKFFYLLNNL